MDRTSDSVNSSDLLADRSSSRGQLSRPHLPKEILIREILDLDETVIRDEFGGASNSTLEGTLGRQTKSRLAEFLIRVQPGARAVLEKLALEYPLRSAPTVYVLKTVGPTVIEALIKKVEDLSNYGQKKAEKFDARESVGSVFIDQPSRTVGEQTPMLEIRVGYLRRIPYRQADPASPRYREEEFIESYEQALLWLPYGNPDFVVLASCDFSALKPIRIYAANKLDLAVISPAFTVEMFKRIAGKSSPRTATFASHSFAATTAIDVSTVTLADPRLPTKRVFLTVVRDPQKQQTAGYFTGGDLIQDSGFAVSRKRGSVWTPSWLDRGELAQLAANVIGRVRKELLKTQSDWKKVTGIYAKLPIEVGGSRLTGEARAAAGHLAACILESARGLRSVGLLNDEIDRLVRNQARLHLLAQLETECDNCGVRSLVRCTSCGGTVRVTWSDGHLRSECKDSCKFNGRVSARFQCECGAGGAEDVDVVPQAIVLTPLPELCTALEKFTNEMGTPFRGIFRIAQASLLAARSAKDPNFFKIGLNDLEKWRQFGLSREFAPERREKLLKVIAATKEKCTRRVVGGKSEFVEGSPPSEEKCGLCKRQTLSTKLLLGGELCLQRVFGIPIEVALDGVHHGRELADVRYMDSHMPGGRQTLVAIHLKSRTTDKPQGLGRSVRAVKELYAQFFHLAFAMLTQKSGREHAVGVLGASIPNRLSEDVRQSFFDLAAQLGITAIVLEEDDWVSIFDAAERRLSEQISRIPVQSQKAGLKVRRGSA